MKQILLFSLLILGSLSLTAQAPDSISFQAVIRADDGTLLANQEVGVRIVITKGAQQKTNSIEPIDFIISSGFIYEETHQVTTNDNGLVSLIIGNGTVGPESYNTDLSGIDWSDGPYYITRSIDPEGGTNYSITGESQILSVPYALSAKSVSSDTIARVKGTQGTLISSGDGKHIRITNKPSGEDISNLQSTIEPDIQIYSSDDIYMNAEQGEVGMYAKGGYIYVGDGYLILRSDLAAEINLGGEAKFSVKDASGTLYYTFPDYGPSTSQSAANDIYVLGRAAGAGKTLSWIRADVLSTSKIPDNSPSTFEHFEELERKANEMSLQLEESLARIQELEKLISNQQKLIETQLEWNKKLETKLQSN